MANLGREDVKDSRVKVADPDSPERMRNLSAVTNRRKRWLIWGALLVLVLVVAGLLVYVNLSTPSKTLSNFCDAVIRNDPQGAYSQFSISQPVSPNEAEFTTFLRGASSQLGGIKSCTVQDVAEDNANATGQVIWMFGNGKSLTFHCFLQDENGTWKMIRL